VAVFRNEHDAAVESAIAAVFAFSVLLEESLLFSGGTTAAAAAAANPSLFLAFPGDVAVAGMVLERARCSWEPAVAAVFTRLFLFFGEDQLQLLSIRHFSGCSCCCFCGWNVGESLLLPPWQSNVLRLSQRQLTVNANKHEHTSQQRRYLSDVEAALLGRAFSSHEAIGFSCAFESWMCTLHNELSG